MEPIRTSAGLYAHALAMEEEAAHRYVDLALRMRDEGHPPLAELFWRLGRMEGEHYAELLRRADRERVALPPVRAGEHRWIDPAPQAAARELVFRLLTPRRALALALDAEKRARDFFYRAASLAPEAAIRERARALAAEESEHIALLLRALQGAPADPAAASDWDRLFVECAA